MGTYSRYQHGAGLNIRRLAISIQLVFKVHIQSRRLYHRPVIGTHSGYELGCVSRTVG